MGEASADTLLGWHARRARCHYCAEPGNRKKLTRDHIVPRSRGGVTSWWNLVWACEPCNKAKAAILPTCRCDHCVLAVWLHIESLDDLPRTERRAMVVLLEGLDPYYEEARRRA